MQTVALLEWDWIFMRSIFLMSSSKPSKVGTEHAWSNMFTEKKFLLCLQIKGLCERKKGQVELFESDLLPKLVPPKAAPSL